MRAPCEFGHEVSGTEGTLVTIEGLDGFTAPVFVCIMFLVTAKAYIMS